MSRIRKVVLESTYSLRIDPRNVKKSEKDFWQGTRRLRIGQYSVEEPKKEFDKKRLVLELICLVSRSQKRSFGKVRTLWIICNFTH